MMRSYATVCEKYAYFKTIFETNVKKRTLRNSYDFLNNTVVASSTFVKSTLERNGKHQKTLCGR